MPKGLSRRNALRGAGLTLALPFFESLLPRSARGQAAAASPKRFLPVFFPNGAGLNWREKTPAYGTQVEGAAFALGSAHEPLASLKDKVCIVSRLGHWRRRGDAAGMSAGSVTHVFPGHGRSPSGWLTGVDGYTASQKAGEADYPVMSHCAISADQLIAKSLTGSTPISSLVLGLGTRPGTFDRFTHRFNMISWAAPDNAILRNVDPKAVFDQIVASGAVSMTGAPPPPDMSAFMKQLAAENKSVLDVTRQHAASISARLGTVDKQSFDQYLTRLRDTEVRLTTYTPPAVPAGGAVNATLPAKPGFVPDAPGENQGLSQGSPLPGGGAYDRAAHAAIMNDLIVLAFHANVTQVISYMLDDERSEFDYNQVVPAADRLGVTAGAWDYHGASHGGTLEYQAITRWMVRITSNLAQALDAIPEGNGRTVLDNTLILLGGAQNSGQHQSNDLPNLLIGGTGTFKGNMHVAYPIETSPDERQMRDLLFTILNNYYKLGVTTFGDDLVSGKPNRVLTEILV